MDERLPSQGGEPTQQPQYSQPQGVQPPPPSYAPAPSPGNKFSLILRAVLGLLVLGIIIVGALIAVPLFMPKSVENVTLTYWGLWEDESVMRPIFEEFKKTTSKH